jgi:SpoVK/Ycf46/Vps4 family AAA+-type ATPase
MWLGGTEKNISLAFSEALKDNKFLLFDEADSFFRDRRVAARSWEITVVNEMLTWMESHPLPFACTTNIADTLDRASLRRFTFKVKFSYLNYSQATYAFEYFFGIQKMIKLDYLTPADFVLAKQKADILNITKAEELYELLSREMEAKGEKTAAIGF